MIDRYYGNIAKLSNDAYIAFRIRDLSRPMNRHRCQQPMRAADLDHSARSTSLVTRVYSLISFSSSSFPRPQRVKTISTVRRRAIPNKALFVLSTCFPLFCDAFNLLDWLVMYIDVWRCSTWLSFIFHRSLHWTPACFSSYARLFSNNPKQWRIKIFKLGVNLLEKKRKTIHLHREESSSAVLLASIFIFVVEDHTGTLKWKWN